MSDPVPPTHPADARVADLVDKWLASLALHRQYANLTDEAYWQVQPWPHHQRPARWIVDLAYQRASDLRSHIGARALAGDAGFAEALELMAFLANLVGVQHIERFIPLAEPGRENREALASTLSTLKPLEHDATATQARPMLEATREMPLPRDVDAESAAVAASPLAVPAEPAPAGASAATALTPPPGPRAAARASARPGSARAVKGPLADGVAAQIVADAVRLLKWGREWHELAESIARIAGRPGVVEVRKCLRQHKDEIERGAAG